MRALSVLAPVVLLACGGHGGGQRAEPVQAPVATACTKDARSIADFGLVTRTEFSGDAQAKVIVTNASSERHAVSPKMVAFCRGPCDGAWTSCKNHRRFTDAERARYQVTLGHDESIELLVDARIGERQNACEKDGLFLILGVDRTTACTDVGTWISLGRE